MNYDINNKNYVYSLLQSRVSSSVTHKQIYNKTSLTRLQNPLKTAFLPSSTGFCSLIGTDNVYFIQLMIIKDTPLISLKLHKLENCSFPLPPALFSCMMNLGMFAENGQEIMLHTDTPAENNSMN